MMSCLLFCFDCFPFLYHALLCDDRNAFGAALFLAYFCSRWHHARSSALYSAFLVLSLVVWRTTSLGSREVHATVIPFVLVIEVKCTVRNLPELVFVLHQ